jgi:hypothetical protein
MPGNSPAISFTQRLGRVSRVEHADKVVKVIFRKLTCVRVGKGRLRRAADGGAGREAVTFRRVINSGWGLLRPRRTRHLRLP